MTQPPLNPYLEYRTNPAGIREIAQRQRAILFCILGIFVLYVPLLAAQGMLPRIAWLLVPLAALAILAVEIIATVFVFLLTTKLYGTGIGVLLGILTLIPCVGLITLLIINAKATAILKAAGLKVGLLGASVPDNM